MSRHIILPTIEAAVKFVCASEKSHSAVHVTNENLLYQLNGASLMGMVSVIGDILLITYGGKSSELIKLIEQYSV